jgi:hypothetical protein
MKRGNVNFYQAVNSKSVGDPARFIDLEELERLLMNLPASPRNEGRIALIMCRGQGGERKTLSDAVLTVDNGIPGDAWGRDKMRDRTEQIAVMQKDVAELIANGQPLTLSGDCLVLDLDLSADNLPPGSRLQIGNAMLEVTAKPHNGCSKFKSRFGEGALQLVSKTELRHRNLRGIYMRVAKDGAVKTGDIVQVLARAT